MAEPLMIRGRPPRSTAVALLQAQGLPVSDITDEHLEHFFFIGSDGSPTGLVGIEIYGADALLRSLVVAETARTQGPGRSSRSACRGIRSLAQRRCNISPYEYGGELLRASWLSACRSHAGTSSNPIDSRVRQPLPGELSVHAQATLTQ